MLRFLTISYLIVYIITLNIPMLNAKIWAIKISKHWKMSWIPFILISRILSKAFSLFPKFTTHFNGTFPSLFLGLFWINVLKLLILVLGALSESHDVVEEFIVILLKSQNRDKPVHVFPSIFLSFWKLKAYWWKNSTGIHWNHEKGITGTWRSHNNSFRSK